MEEKKEKALTPEEFAKKMADIRREYEDDTEAVHIKMDDAMCSLLRSLGYGDGIAIFAGTSVWYA